MAGSAPSPTTDRALSRFAADTRAARRVLVVDLGFLGDAVQLIPALWELRRHYTQAELHLVSTPSACDVIGLTRAVDQFWPVELRPEHRSLWAQLRLISALRRRRFEVAINLTAADRSVILTGLVGASQRLGLLGGRWHAWNRWLIRHWLPQPEPSQPMFEQFRQALAVAGFSLGAPRFDLQVPEPDRQWAGQTVPAGALHMSLCSANPLKEWPVTHHAALCGALLSERPGLPIVVSASARPREQQRLTALSDALGAHRIQRLPPDMSVARLAAALTRCSLHLGPDSGVIHVAMALGIPTISFFRRRGTGWQGWIPRGTEHRSFLQECSCTRDRDAPCAARGVPFCLEALRPETVLEACLACLGPK